MDAKKIEEIQGMIKRHQETIKPAGHNRCDEDMCKVATAEVIGKTVNHTEELKK
jgi:hypothetical protein